MGGLASAEAEHGMAEEELLFVGREVGLLCGVDGVISWAVMSSLQCNLK